jgi:hypothetical protein
MFNTLVDHLWIKATDYIQWHSVYLNFHLTVGFLILVWRQLPSNNTCRLTPPPSSPKCKPPSKRALESNSSSFDAPPSTISCQSSTDDEDSKDGAGADDLRLEKEVPDATVTERQRFLKSNNGKVDRAVGALGKYIEWNKVHEAISKELNIESPSKEDSDVDYWKAACAVAIKAKGEDCTEILPQVIRVHQLEDGSDMCDATGHRIFQITPANMDDKLVKTTTYALAVALYLNRRCDRNGLERITICMDLRAGKGWPNIHAARLVPFMKDSTRLLSDLFPERLHRCVLYPVPPAFTWIWNIIKKAIDPRTRDKVCPLSGANKIESPPPREHMLEHMSEEAADRLEKERVDSFKE